MGHYQSLPTDAITEAERLAEIYYYETSGLIDSVTLVETNHIAVDRHVQGVMVDAHTNAVTVEIKSSTMNTYRNAGITLGLRNDATNNITANVHHNTITGDGPLSDHLQNGIQIRASVVANVDYNTVSNVQYAPESEDSTGILFWGADSGGSANYNTISDCDNGIAFLSTNGTGTGNTVTSCKEGLQAVCWTDEGNYEITFNDNTVSSCSVAGMIAYGLKAGATLDVTFQDNDLSAGGAGSGIMFSGTSATVNATVSGNTITGWSNSGVSIPSDFNVSGIAINSNDIVGNTSYGIHNASTTGGTLDAENNWWGNAGGPDGTNNPNGTPTTDGGGDDIGDYVDADPWVGKADNTADHEEITEAGATATLDLKGGQADGSELYVDMDADKTGTFTAVEEAEAPSQGFTGMGANGGINKTITITTNADDGDFIMCVKFHYTDAELGTLSEDDLRLCYWDTANSEWKLAVAGNTAGTATWKGNCEPPTSPTSTELGWHGVDQVNNIAWAVVDHCTEYGAGEEPPGEGSFEVSPPSVTVTFSETSMTPLHEQTVTVAVTVDSALTLADLTALEFKVWYDSDATADFTTDADEDGIPDEFAALSGATQTCAVISWDGTNYTMDSQADGEATTTWELGSCSYSDSDLTRTFTLNFTPGKVATEADGASQNWQLAASVTGTQSGNGFDYDDEASSMDWYGCLILSAAITVDWGVVPAGLDFAEDGLSEEAWVPP